MRERAGQAGLTVAARGEAEWIGDGIADESDGCVAEVQEVPCGERSTGRVVADDAWHAIDRWRVDIDEDDRDGAAQQGRDDSVHWRQ